MWAGRYEEVLKVLFLRSVVVILGGLCAPALWTAIGTGYDAAKEKVQESKLKDQAIASCIAINASPREYRSSVREYCEEVWQLHAR